MSFTNTPGRASAGAGVLVVVPTYNEAANVARIVDAVLAVLPEGTVLVVDDGSPDGTGAIVAGHPSPRVHLLERTAKQGLGRAYLAGFGWGLEQGYERFVEIDADFSHDPSDLPALAAATEQSDVAIGSRYVPGGQVIGWSRNRELLSRFGNTYARWLLGFPFRDATSGFRCYRRAVLEAIPLDEVASQGYAFQIDMTYRAWRLGFTLQEIPIAFRDREDGRSKMSKAIVIEAVTSVAGWAVRDRLRRSRRRTSRGPAGSAPGTEDTAGNDASGPLGPGLEEPSPSGAPARSRRRG
jgi:dolichol-phosphate mannosyltransferase